MKTMEIKITENGLLKLPPGATIPPDARLAVLVFEPSKSQTDDVNGESISRLAQQSGTFDFLKEEPEIYSDSDILPGRENPEFRK